MLQNDLLNPFEELRREMTRLLDNFGLGLTRGPLGGRETYPAVNVWDAGEAICVEAEVPGIRKEDIEILAAGNELTIKGRRMPLEGNNLVYHRQERPTGVFTRVLTLPVEIDADRVEAVVDDGVLMIRLPKAEAAKPRKITVKAS